jgi:DNA-binding response OmpR family regulator
MGKSARILVVDDDPDLGEMLKLMLEYKGYDVTLSERAEKAEEILRNNTIDLVIMDMLLSGANGVDVCARLKQNSASHMPIMMISAHPNAKEICISAGADDFISKPFDMHDMLSKVNYLINKEQKT